MKYTLLLLLLSSLPMMGGTTTLTIGIDLSGSNPLLAHEHFAQAAAEHMRREITGLKTGDVVRLNTFGSRSDALNQLSYRFVISRRQRAEVVAVKVAQFIGSLPARKDVSQSSTNLIAWLEFTGGFDCTHQGQIVVITDGLEASHYVEATQLLDGSGSLPDPDVDLKGCALTFYGLGAGLPAPAVKTVRNAWRQWAASAGANFNAVIR